MFCSSIKSRSSGDANHDVNHVRIINIFNLTANMLKCITHGYKTKINSALIYGMRSLSDGILGTSITQSIYSTHQNTAQTVRPVLERI